MATKLTIRRRRVIRNIGLSAVARKLGVKKQAVASFVAGNISALRPEFRNRIKIIDENKE